MAQRPTLPADRERKCPARRSTRHAIGRGFPDAELPTAGLTLSEVARPGGLRRWRDGMH